MVRQPNVRIVEEKKRVPNNYIIASRKDSMMLQVYKGTRDQQFSFFDEFFLYNISISVEHLETSKMKTRLRLFSYFSDNNQPEDDGPSSKLTIKGSGVLYRQRAPVRAG